MSEQKHKMGIEKAVSYTHLWQVPTAICCGTKPATKGIITGFILLRCPFPDVYKRQEFPLGKLICVTGVSGSGKSTLINETLQPILSEVP